jgi:hypothetical protein
MTELQRLQEQVLTELADGGFADKRTDVQAWEMALNRVRHLKRCAERAHEKLQELGVTGGVLSLVERV